MVKNQVLDDSGKMSAAHISLAAMGDATMRPPPKPSVIGGLQTERVDDGVLITGGPKPVFLSGRFAQTNLLAMLEQLDGTQDIDQLSTSTGLGAPDLRAALALLHAKRLLQWGPLEEQGVSSEVAVTLSARLANSRYFKNSSEAFAHGAANPLRVLGEDPLIDRGRLMDQFSATGLRVADNEASLGPASLTIVLGDGADQDINAMRARGRVVLHAYTQNSLLVLSPLIREDLPCHACFRTAMGQGGVSELESRHSAPLDMNNEMARRIATPLLAGNVVTIALRTAQIKLIRRAVALDLAEGEERLIDVHAQPGCRHCGVDPAPAETTPLIYEDLVAFPPADLLDPATHLTHYKPSNVDLQRPGRTLSDTHPAIGDQDVDDESVRRLFHTLRLTFGFKPGSSAGQYLRYAPTGGNLGSPQCDVLVGDGVVGVDPAHYRYEGANERLVRISDRVLPVPEGTVQVILSAGLAHMGSKYGVNALRLVHLDAGVTRAQLLAAAVGNGLEPRLHLRSDTEELQRQIHRPRKSDPITSMISLRVGASRQHSVAEDTASGWTDVSPPSEGTPDTAPQEAVDGAAEDSGVLDALLRFAPRGTDTTAVRAVGGTFAGLDAGIQGRASHRMWAPQPVALEPVRDVAARIMGVRDELTQASAAPKTDFAVIGQHVEGTSPRSWTITPDGSLEVINLLEDQPLAEAVIQPEYALAPVLVVATIRLAELSRQGGVRDYLDAVMEAGTGLHAGWLQMRRHGLEGGVFAGILPDKSVRRLLNGSLWDRRPVLALAMGHPLASQEEQP